MRYETRLAPARLPLPPTHTDPRGARAMPISTTITASDLGAHFSLPSSDLDRTTPETMGSARRPPPDRASENHADGPPWVRPTRRGRVASSHARRFPRRRRLPRDRRRAAPRGSSAGARTHPRRTTDRAGIPPPRWTSISPPSRSAPRDARSASTETLPFPRRRARRARTITPRRTTAEYDTVVAYFARVFRSENEGENTRRC